MGHLESFCIGVVGDFSGSGPSRDGPPQSEEPRLREIDRDDFDRVLAAMSPEVRPELPFCRRLRFERWRDFHPDGLVERCPELVSLVEAREAVDDPARMRRHLAEAGVDWKVLFSPQSARPSGEPSAPADAGPRPEVNGGQLLESMLGDAGSGGREPRTAGRGDGAAAGSVDRAIREIVEGAADSTDYAERDRRRAAIDHELSERVRQILWHADFRSLEASWHSLRDLVRGSATGERLHIFVADFGQRALRHEVERETPLERSSLFRLLVDDERDGPGESSFDLWLTDYRFDAGAQSQRELVLLSDLAERARVPILAGARGSATALQDASERDLADWNQLQRRPGARRIGLCAPRLLLRQPYGEQTDPVDSFAFEEGVRADRAADHLWGSAAFGLARAAARAIAEWGDLAAVDRCLDLEGLPLHVDRLADEPRAQGPVEEVLTATRLEAWSLMGLVPITGIRGGDSARILSLRSLARTPLF